MSGYVFPTSAYNADDSVLLPIPKADIPFFRRLWEVLQDRSTWYSREDWFRGYQEAAWLEEMMMTNTLVDLVEGQNRLYRLLDTALNGTEYTATPDGAGGIAISPQIADAPPISVDAPNAMRAHVGRLWHLVENLTSGTTYAAGAGIEGAPALSDAVALRDVLRRIISGIDGGANPPATNLVELLDQAETLLADIRDKLV